MKKFHKKQKVYKQRPLPQYASSLTGIPVSAQRLHQSERGFFSSCPITESAVTRWLSKQTWQPAAAAAHCEKVVINLKGCRRKTVNMLNLTIKQVSKSVWLFS